MPALPAAVSHYLESLLAGHKSPAVIKVDRGGNVVDAGGNLDCYGIKHLEKGRSLSEQVPVFEGLLPADQEPVALPAVQTADTGTADVHLIAAQDGDWVLLLRAEAVVDSQQPRQQSVNELALLREERDRLEDKLKAIARDEPATSAGVDLGFEMFHTMDIVALEYQGGRKFKLLSPPTSWFHLFVENAAAGDDGLLLGDRFTFIGNFLADGELFWRQKRPGQLKSGLWSELSDQGEEHHLEATAFRLSGRSILLIESATERFCDRHFIIQKAREGNLEAQKQLRASREARADLADKARELARSNTDLADFAYVASHDLRSPLRAMGSLCHWLEEDLGSALTDEARGHLEMLKARVSLMDRLIEDLLAYARAGRQKGTPETVEVADLLKDAVFLLDPPEGFEIRFPPDLPRLETERAPLTQVFSNLIENAIKHHDRASGRIDVDATEHDEFWEFSVRDDGPGIPAKSHERAFQMFRKLHGDEDRTGSGMGLAMVRKLVESCGGQIALDAPGERGCCFRFTWPKHPPSADSSGS